MPDHCTDPGTEVLVNIPGYTDPAAWKEAETAVTGLRARELARTPIIGDFDLPPLQAIHAAWSRASTPGAAACGIRTPAPVGPASRTVCPSSSPTRPSACSVSSRRWITFAVGTGPGSPRAWPGRGERRQRSAPSVSEHEEPVHVVQPARGRGRMGPRLEPDRPARLRPRPHRRDLPRS